MTNPTIAAPIATNNTAAADRSLIAPIFGFSSMVMKSHNLSIAELNASAANTKTIDIIMNNHSVIEISRIEPRITALKAATRCNTVLGSFLNKIISPLNA